MGVYVLDKDRRKRRGQSKAKAPAWWKSFHFDLIDTTIDEKDSSIIVAIYRYNPSTAAAPPPPSAPRYVIAFRGTIISRRTGWLDAKHDLRIIRHMLHETNRFRSVMEKVLSTIYSVGHNNVWLAGHSLGSAFAILVGKNMARKGIQLDSFLFNPPFFSIPTHILPLDKDLDDGFRIVHSYVTAWLSSAVGWPESEDSFDAISSWFPTLFVNEKDFICSEAVKYFEHRKKMEDIGAGQIENIARQQSLRAMFMWMALGKKSDPVHLLPSANLHINQRRSMNPLRAHKLRQWWKPNLHLEKRRYT